MNLIINHTSMQPIYEQIAGQIKDGILHGKMKEGSALPSVRAMAQELRVSALTVKKAYDALETEGFVVTVHGKGSFVAPVGQTRQREARLQELEGELEACIRKAKSLGLSPEEIREMFELLMEDGK